MPQKPSKLNCFFACTQLRWALLFVGLICQQFCFAWPPDDTVGEVDQETGWFVESGASSHPAQYDPSLDYNVPLIVSPQHMSSGVPVGHPGYYDSRVPGVAVPQYAPAPLPTLSPSPYGQAPVSYSDPFSMQPAHVVPQHVGLTTPIVDPQYPVTLPNPYQSPANVMPAGDFMALPHEHQSFFSDIASVQAEQRAARTGHYDSVTEQLRQRARTLNTLAAHSPIYHAPAQGFFDVQRRFEQDRLEREAAQEADFFRRHSDILSLSGFSKKSYKEARALAEAQRRAQFETLAGATAHSDKQHPLRSPGAPITAYGPPSTAASPVHALQAALQEAHSQISGLSQDLAKQREKKESLKQELAKRTSGASVSTPDAASVSSASTGSGVPKVLALEDQEDSVHDGSGTPIKGSEKTTEEIAASNAKSLFRGLGHGTIADNITQKLGDVLANPDATQDDFDKLIVPADGEGNQRLPTSALATYMQTAAEIYARKQAELAATAKSPPKQAEIQQELDHLGKFRTALDKRRQAELEQVTKHVTNAQARVSELETARGAVKTLKSKKGGYAEDLEFGKDKEKYTNLSAARDRLKALQKQQKRLTKAENLTTGDASKRGSLFKQGGLQTKGKDKGKPAVRQQLRDTKEAAPAKPVSKRK